MSAVAYDTSGPFAVTTSQGSPGSWSIFSCRTGQCSVAVVDTQLVTKYLVPHRNSRW
jgi:hypothetical protein